MHQQRVPRLGAMAVAAAFALVVLAACGERESVTEDVTRVPEMSEAAAQATREAPVGGTPAVAAGEGAETPAAAIEGGEAPAAAQTVEVISVDIAFQPEAVTIPADTDVTFTLPNNGAAPHNFSIDALNISIDQAPGSVEEVVINAPAGEYEYYCNVPGHKEAGMVGTLTVSADAAPAAAEGTAESAEEATPAAADATLAAEATPMAAVATPFAATPVVATPAAAEATPVTSAGAATPAAAAGTAADAVEIVSRDIAFEPEAVTIPADTDVTFTLPNKGVAPHNFSIDALDISVDLPPGAAEEIVVNAPAGTYEYYCNVPGHKPAGMVGTLTVE